MSAQPGDSPQGTEPLFPMPPKTETALRVAVKRIDPAAAVRFEQEFHAAWQEAVQTDSTVPMHTFLHTWAVWVALHRYPDRSARLRDLERRVAEATTSEDAKRHGSGIAELLKTAADEAAAG